MEHTIEIYSTSTCHYCQLAKEFFRGKNIAFTEYNVGLDPEKRNEMINLTGQMGVPVIVIDGKAMVGFSEERINQLLASSNASESKPEQPKETNTQAKTAESSNSMWDKVRKLLGMK